ncbi:hypothetical protein [Pseudomonas coleopterorum]|uniref:Uncharacterized protein n=1 Tax=Pseudomonas coleopterorum TaxID=1605838 RepID=A0AAJ6LYH2_9PSED|nr:hypothetical protein [Pseudomonas coleopterorum]WNC09322.1 hypothetical protein RI108_18960 [Pseudomonas coleopterorum]
MSSGKQGSKKKQRMAPPKSGTCALLGVQGTFAKAHLIPRAFTGTDVPGERFIEAGRGHRPVRRFSSWYDHQLVITDGEKILSDLDNDGIAELRKKRLVWSGFGGKKSLDTDDLLVPPDPHSGISIRSVTSLNSDKIRLFLLSVLWRSLRTKIKEFSYLENIGLDLDVLGRHIAAKDPGHPSYLPIMLSQISTVGFTHNHSPTIQEIEHPDGNGGTQPQQFYRLYMQGLIAHIYPENCQEIFERSRAAFVGGSDALMVIAHKFENSRQFLDAKETMTQSMRDWPGFR